MSISTNGAVNKLDTGTVAASTFYWVWLISNGTTFGGLYSLSPTAPSLPSGYTYKLLVGCVQTDGSSHIIQTIQIGQHVTYAVQIQVVADTTHNGGPFNVVDLTGILPPDYAWDADLYMQASANYSAIPSAPSIEMLIGPDFVGIAPVQIGFSKYPPNASKQSLLTAQDRVTIFNEGTEDFVWQTNIDATSLVSFATAIYLKGYTLTRLSIF
jgi:hypothetical protein